MDKSAPRNVASSLLLTETPDRCRFDVKIEESERGAKPWCSMEMLYSADSGVDCILSDSHLELAIVCGFFLLGYRGDIGPRQLGLWYGKYRSNTFNRTKIPHLGLPSRL